MTKIDIEVNANVDENAKWILSRQERMEKQRCDFIADLYRYTANLILTYDEVTYDEDKTEADGEREDNEH